MKLKFKRIDFIILLLYIAIFKIYAIPQIAQQVSKILFLIVILLFLISHIAIKKLFNLSFLLSIMFILSGVLSFYSGMIGVDKLLDGILYAVCVYCIYTVIQYCSENHYLNRLLNNIFYLTCIYCLISLISIGIVGTSSVGADKIYFFGNKFSTCYFFIMCTALYYVIHNNEINKFFRYKMKYLLLCVFTISLCAWIHCSSAMLASFILFLGLLLPIPVKYIAMRPSITLISMIVAGLIIFSINVILSNSYVQYFISDILGKSLGLTGRLYIYMNLVGIIKKRIFFGYGYNSSVIISIIGYGNTQNGLMELLVNYGVLGLIVFLYCVCFCLKCSSKNIKYFGLYIFMYVMIACSIVEISYNFYFFFALFILRWTQEKNSNHLE